MINIPVLVAAIEFVASIIGIFVFVKEENRPRVFILVLVGIAVTYTVLNGFMGPTPPATATPPGVTPPDVTLPPPQTEEPLDLTICSSKGVPTSACTGVTANYAWSPVIMTFNGVDMVLVPSGCFQMGSNEGEGGETPVTMICLSRPYWIDVLEVSNSQFQNHSGVAARASYWPEPDGPREEVTWREAADYCQIRGARLPNEAEWEYAARGPDSLDYPWGNSFNGQAVVWIENAGGQTNNVGSRPSGASWVGALDMSGNVWEWVNSQYRPYPFDSSDGREDSRDSSAMRIIRGGAWGDKAPRLRAAFRFEFDPNRAHEGVGFRCVIDFD